MPRRPLTYAVALVIVTIANGMLVARHAQIIAQTGYPLVAVTDPRTDWQASQRMFHWIEQHSQPGDVVGGGSGSGFGVAVVFRASDDQCSYAGAVIDARGDVLLEGGRGKRQYDHDRNGEVIYRVAARHEFDDNQRIRAHRISKPSGLADADFRDAGGGVGRVFATIVDSVLSE